MKSIQKDFSKERQKDLSKEKKPGVFGRSLSPLEPYFLEQWFTCANDRCTTEVRKRI